MSEAQVQLYEMEIEWTRFLKWQFLKGIFLKLREKIFLVIAIYVL